MKIGMIGIGDIAKKAYLPVLSQMKGIELHIFTRNKETLNDVAATYHIEHVYQNLEELLESEIDAAFVHSSTSSHEEIIDKLLDYGIHVYVDKPITYFGDTSTKLIEKAKSKGLILMVGFNRRYAPPYRQLTEVSNPNMIIMQKNRSHLPDDIRTFIFDDFIHVIDTLLYLFPYTINEVIIRGKENNGELHHVTLQLEANEGTAIGIMNRDAGTTEEIVEVKSPGETRKVVNVSDITSHQNKKILSFGSDDWQPTLEKRGFHDIISYFLNLVRNKSLPYTAYDRDLKTHLLAEQIVQHLKNIPKK
ncbi:Gfo/Idh/MocA family protein [Lederbergia wuyishanensis]|uniref:Virulence factor n=1 Tax=Lederbergia wuyishanensis TaxID=1347903 RepID=A0ABU0D5E9_9BACI|nr:Gfo/Idh/MocA family oxidoreductase [Lederbergia wuyishanensis]MCJ8009875.1 Gfo/Idh/MocA family oxidoreductase [Lederbergia wuyishanensis]MDQ0343588.1 virulence factor [Lederbergia wuyishanensis]